MATPGLAAFAAEVKSALDDLMLERGFARGQGGHDSPGPVDIIYCTALTDFRERWPRVFAALDARYGDDLGESVTCIDLTVTGSIAEGVAEVHLEAVPLEQLTDPTEAALVQEVDLSSQLELLGGRIAHLLPT